MTPGPVRGHLDQLDLWEQRSRQSQAQLAQLHQIAQDARTRLADVSPQQQRRIYEPLQIAIRVTPERTLDITGSIPTHGTLNPDETSGQLSAKAPRHR
ncbi:MAG: hypothetical protein KKE89_06285 [Actinobacteria bacterium]|nr:hypothetical protein [Actinomycetota bacterium]